MRALQPAGPHPSASAPQLPPRLLIPQQLPLLALTARQRAPPSTWPLRCKQDPSYAGVVDLPNQRWLQHWYVHAAVDIPGKHNIMLRK